MNITRLGAPKIIMQNSRSLHNYFAWPSAARLQNGKIAVVASGYRLSHVCPFGKAVIAYSEDEGESYTAPAAVIDTILDDRDAGILTFGTKNVIVTSFNNTVAFQRKHAAESPYRAAYLDHITSEAEREAWGATFRISHDNGVTFEGIHRSPVTSPHGPIELHDGTVLWVGRTFDPRDSFGDREASVQAWEILPDGSMKMRGSIPPIMEENRIVMSCEPYAIETKKGSLICHIRAEGNGFFSTYQSESDDSGVTWSLPHPLLPKTGGAPAHILKHSSGILISAYGYRCMPYGIRIMFSTDGGRTWDTDHILYENEISADLGYPATIELHDGSLLSVFYAHPEEGAPAVIMQQKWRFSV